MDLKFKKTEKKGTLVSMQRRRKIVNAVLLVHVAVLILPLAVFKVAEFIKTKKKKDVIVVKLVEIPKEITKVTEKPGSSRKVEKPKKKTDRKKPAPQKKTPKKVVKPTKKPAKTVEKKTPAKKVVKPTRKVAAKPKYTPPSPPDDLEVLRPEDLKRVPTQEEEDDAEEDDEFGATYNEQLVGVIYKLWVPPNKQVLANRKPEVHVEIRINRYGRVLEKKVVKKSNFWPMDLSVTELFKKMIQLPAPPNEVWMKKQRNGSMEMEFVLVPFD